MFAPHKSRLSKDAFPPYVELKQIGAIPHIYWPVMEKMKDHENPEDLALEVTIYDEDGVLLNSFVRNVVKQLEGGDANQLLSTIEDLHGSELGDLLEALNPLQRNQLVELAAEDFDLSSLTEVDEAIRLGIVNALPNEQIAEGVQEIDSDDAVYILEDMEQSDQEEILAILPFEARQRLRRSLDYPVESAGRRMQTELVAVPEFWSVGQTIDHMRAHTELPDRFHEVFVIGPAFGLHGSVTLDAILRSSRDELIKTIMGETLHSVDANLDQEEAAHMFEQYDLLSAAVVDENNRLVGVLTIDDVVDVIHQEADEDIKLLAGVGDEELSDSFWAIAQSRIPWLLVNLATAILASFVIGLFDATLQEMVALAILMPIVASMGGNAGTQTMTVAVRAIAMRDIDIYNAGRIIRREFLVGVLNGVVFAVIIGVVSGIWFDSPQLGGVIAAAMMFNMVCAAIAGISIPLLLDRLDADPAIASSVFVTTVTDVFGFFAFLGLASLLLV